MANRAATLKVRDEGANNRFVVEWSSEFEAAGTPQSQAERVIRGIYEAGFKNLKARFGGS